MAKEAFIQKRFGDAALTVIEAANEILREYHAKGFTMTLRQLHYQFVARKVLISPPGKPEEHYTNTQKSYKRLGNIISDARLAGLVDWAMMEDRVRTLDGLNHWDSPEQIIAAVANQYRTDRWEGQKYRPEVWIEKDALAGVIENICNTYRVRFFACRGYVSQSAQYEAAKRFNEARRDGQTPIVFHLGDHDPSGLDMSRENAAKFELLTRERVELRRLALNFDQVQLYNPPPNPAKMTDTRADDYVRRYGDESWELDALPPDVIEGLIRDAIDPIIDRKAWRKAEAREATEKNQLQKVSLNWNDIVADLP
jgi:hypothetical protein